MNKATRAEVPIYRYNLVRPAKQEGRYEFETHISFVGSQADAANIEVAD
jgi:hypothetical protein